MSIYIGKDNNNYSKMIISKSVASLDYLKTISSLNPNIVFNSQLPYMAVDYLTINNFTVYTYTSDSGTYSSTPAYEYVHTFTQNELSILFINNQQRYVGLFLDSTQLTLPLSNSTSGGRLFALFGISSTSITSSQITIYTPTRFSSLKLVVFPFTLEGTILTNPFSNVSTVKIGAGDILFDNKSLFKMKYLVEGTVNNTDSTVNLFGTAYQIVNSSTPTGSVVLNVSNGVTSISCGSKTVLHSGYTYTPLLLQNNAAQTRSYSNVNLTLNADPQNTPNTWTKLSGFNFIQGKIYVIKVGVIATMVQNASWYYTTWIVEADSVSRLLSLNWLPSAQGGVYIAATLIRVSPSSIDLTMETAIDSTPTGPDGAIYYGPYNYSFTYYQVTA